MPQQLLTRWKDEMHERLAVDYEFSCTTTVNLAIQWLVVKLSESGRRYIIHNLGAGVKQITTNTDTCPCCKKKL